MPTTEQRSATFRFAAARRGRTLAFALAALICAVLLAGCSIPTLKVVNSGVAIEGGSCDLAIQAANLKPNTTYGIGMYTTGAPDALGDLTTNLAGSIHGSVDYPSDTLPRIYSDVSVAVYTLRSGGQLGVGLVAVKTGQVPVCLPTGLS